MKKKKIPGLAKSNETLGQAVPANPKEHDEYQVKSAFDDLLRAEEHKQNPKLMALVHKHAHKKKKAIGSIAELRKKRQDNTEENLPEEGLED